MKNSSLSLPEQKNYEYAYDLAYKLASEQLGRVDIEEQCQASGAEYKLIGSQTIIIVEYLNQSYQVAFPDIEISAVGSEAEVPISDKILILHYLAQAKGVPLSNKLVSFQELPEGASYFPTFSKRSIEPLAKYFGPEPKRLIKSAKNLGGHKADYGDVAVTINGFKLVSVTIVLWRGDEEFPPRSNILFDATISNYLSTYDITVLCENITWRLVKSLKEGNSHSGGS